MKLLDLLLVAAAVLIAAGVAMVYVPAGVIVSGVACGAAWFLLGDPS